MWYTGSQTGNLNIIILDITACQTMVLSSENGILKTRLNMHIDN